MSNSDYILFFSNKCLHSKELLNLLSKSVDINQKFKKINIDNQNIKIPPYIKSVPSAIVPQDGSPSLLVGKKIFDWLNQFNKQNSQNEGQGIMDWDPCTMSGYSDGFSYLETDDVMKKNFSFINENNSISTPDEKNYSGNESNKNQPKTQLDNDYENFMNQRTSDIPNAPARL